MCPGVTLESQAGLCFAAVAEALSGLEAALASLPSPDGCPDR